MKLQSILEDNVIPFRKKKRGFQQKVQNIHRGVTQAFADQDEAEQFIKNKIREIDFQSEGRKAKYKNPTIISHYTKQTHPFKALHFELDSAITGHHDNHEMSDDQAQFIINFAKEHIDDILRILDEDHKKLVAARGMIDDNFKHLVASEYVMRIINGVLYDHKKTIEFFQKFKQQIK